MYVRLFRKNRAGADRGGLEDRLCPENCRQSFCRRCECAVLRTRVQGRPCSGKERVICAFEVEDVGGGGCVERCEGAEFLQQRCLCILNYFARHRSLVSSATWLLVNVKSTYVYTYMMADVW